MTDSAHWNTGSLAESRGGSSRTSGSMWTRNSSLVDETMAASLLGLHLKPSGSGSMLVSPPFINFIRTVTWSTDNARGWWIVPVRGRLLRWCLWVLKERGETWEGNFCVLISHNSWSGSVYHYGATLSDFVNYQIYHGKESVLYFVRN